MQSRIAAIASALLIQLADRNLQDAIQEYPDVNNADPTPFGAKTADDILTSIARFSIRTLDDHVLQSSNLRDWTLASVNQIDGPIGSL
jgi:hypothetical protein